MKKGSSTWHKSMSEYLSTGITGISFKKRKFMTTLKVCIWNCGDFTLRIGVQCISLLEAQTKLISCFLFLPSLEPWNPAIFTLEPWSPICINTFETFNFISAPANTAPKMIGQYKMQTAN